MKAGRLLRPVFSCGFLAQAAAGAAILWAALVFYGRQNGPPAAKSPRKKRGLAGGASFCRLTLAQFFMYGQIPIAGKADMADKEKEPELGEAELDARRAALESKLAQRRRAAEAPANDEVTPGQSSSIALALRLSADFFSAVILGAAVGIGFDKLMGTKPWGLAFLLIIGCIAGVVNVLRALGRPLPYQTARDKERSGGSRN